MWERGPRVCIAERGIIVKLEAHAGSKHNSSRFGQVRGCHPRREAKYLRGWRQLRPPRHLFARAGPV